VKTSTAKRVPASRPFTPAIDVASIAHDKSPAFNIARKSRWRSIDSGVFNPVGSSSPPTRRSMFVSSAGRRPAASRIEWTRNAVVVFPFVPVAAMTSSSCDGASKKSVAADGIARRTLGTTSCGTATSTGRSTTSATAPASTAARAKACPSAFAPGMQKKSDPGCTARVS